MSEDTRWSEVFIHCHAEDSIPQSFVIKNTGDILGRSRSLRSLSASQKGDLASPGVRIIGNFSGWGHDFGNNSPCGIRDALGNVGYHPGVVLASPSIVISYKY